MKARYRKTIAGLLWVILSPIIVFSAQSFIFKYILKLEIQNFSLFLLSGLLPWVFITSSLDIGIPSIVSSADLLKSFNINPIILIASQVLDNFINFLLSFTILIIPSIFIYKIPLQGLIALIVPILLLLIFVSLLTSILALLNVFYRDIKFVSSFTMNLLFFATPIFYPESFVPANLKWIVSLNPFYRMIQPIRVSLYQFSPQLYFSSLIPSLVIIILLSIFCIFLWRKKRSRIYSYV